MDIGWFEVKCKIEQNMLYAEIVYRAMCVAVKRKFFADPLLWGILTVYRSKNLKISCKMICLRHYHMKKL